MAVIRRIANGVMDLEKAPYLIKEGDYPYANNISLTITDGSVKPMVGNRRVNYTLPAGSNKVIGFKEDQVRNRSFHFVWNSGGKHSILIFDPVARTVQKLLENITDTGGVDILRWSASYLILHIDILYRDPSEGDILSWVDNSQPKELLINKVLSGAYGVVLEEYIEAGKRPPLASPTVIYQNDLSRQVNSLKKKLFQFKYRFIYDDYSTSTWSPVSKIALPSGLYANPATDNDPRYNNAIDITVETGSRRVSKIEIAGRTNNGNAWADFFSATVLDKSKLGLSSNSFTTYRFLNDSSYADVDARESALLFDWVPKKAGAQALVNGNVKVYAEITEGLNLAPALDIRVTSELATNDSGVVVDPSGPPTLQWIGGTNPSGSNDGYLQLGGSPSPGTRYIVLWRATPFVGPTTFMDYTAVLGDTNASIAAALGAQQPSYVTTVVGSQINIVLLTGQYIFTTQVSGTGGAGAGTNGYENTWNWWSRYRIGVQYYDEQGRTPGVQFDDTTGRANSSVTTQGYALSGGVGQTPELIVEINHAPPSWAKKFQLVRSRNMTIGNFLFWRTDHIANDAQFYYFSIQSLYDRRAKEEGFVPNYSFVEGDRMRVVIQNIGGSQTLPAEDYLIVGVEEADKGAGTKKYIKVRRPDSSPPTYLNPCLIQIWTPAQTGGFGGNEIYYEFGEVFDLYSSGSNLYHRGAIQDQNASQPSIIRLKNGDVYYRNRTFVATDALYVTDPNYNDYFRSAVNSNGRPSVSDPNAKETYFPTLYRYSLAYQFGTFVNDISRFYYENFDEADRGFGPIRRLRVSDRYLRVFQELKVGRIPVYQQVIKDAVGGDILAQSDKILNNIQYYAGDFGIGKHPESLASKDFADYFTDSNRGVVLRLSNDGLTPISIINNANNYFTTELGLRKDASVPVLGVYDPVENRYILTLSQIAGSPAKTIVYNDQRKGFETFSDCIPEFWGCQTNLLVAFKNGEIWTHDSPAFCSFFGVQYKPSIKMIFNDGMPMKKTFQAVSYIAGAKWVCPSIDTSLGQQSRLNNQYFSKKEDVWHSYFLRDLNSSRGLLGGDMLKGQYIIVTFEKDNGATGEEFHYAEVKFVVSNLNNR